MRSHPVLRPLFWLILSSLFLLATPRVLAQEDSAAAPGISYPVANPPILFLWTGLYLDQDGESFTVGPTKDAEKMLRKAILGLEQQTIVTRDLNVARQKLDELWLMANLADGSATKERRSQLILLALARSKNFEQSKSLEQALDALNILALTKSVPELFTSKMTLTPKLIPITQAYQDFLMDVRDDPQLSERRKVILAQMVVSQEVANEFGITPQQSEYLKNHFGLPSKDMHERVRMYLQDSDMGTIQQLGLRAAPSLALHVLSDLNSDHTFFPYDPLAALMKVDVQGGCGLATDYFDQGGPAWKLRILSVTEIVGPRGMAFSWTSSGSENPPESSTPYLVQMVSALTGDSRTWHRVLPYVTQLAENHAIPVEMKQNLSSIIRNGSATDAGAILKSIVRREANPNIRSLLLDGFNHPDPSIRELACKHFLQNQTNVSPLLELMKDPSFEVRKLVAASLSPRKVDIRYGTEYERSNDHYPLEVAPTEENQSALLTLLDDPIVEVRKAAVEALAKGSWNFPTSAPYIKALQLADKQLAELLVTARPTQSLAHQELILAMAQSPRPEIRHALDNHFRTVDWVNDANVFLPAVRIRLLDPKDPFGPYFQSSTRPEKESQNVEFHVRRFLLTQVALTSKGQAEAMQLALETKRPQCLASWQKTLASSSRGRANPDGHPETIYEKWGKGFALLESEFLVMLLAQAQQDADGFYLGAYQTLRSRTDIPEKALGNVALDESRPIQARILALQILIEKQTPQAVDIALSFASKPLSEADADIAKLLGKVYFSNSKQQTQFLARLQSLPDADPFLTMGFFQNYEASSNPNAYARFMIQPWTFETYQHYGTILPRGVVNRLSTLEWTKELEADISLAMASYSSLVFEPIMSLVTRMDKTQFIPLLGQIARESSSPGGTRRQSSAIESLGGFLSKEAVQELVSCLSISGTGTQGDIRKALANIREFNSQKEYWDNAKNAKPSREEAISELISMLDDQDPEIRIMAVNSLAAFGELEVLPRLIQLMREMSKSVKQADKKVADAAQAAIERLQQTIDR